MGPISNFRFGPAHSFYERERERETEIGSRAVTGRMYQGRLPGGGGLQRGVWNSAGQMEKREPPGKGTCLPSRGAEGGERVFRE